MLGRDDSVPVHDTFSSVYNKTVISFIHPFPDSSLLTPAFPHTLLFFFILLPQLSNNYSLGYGHDIISYPLPGRAIAKAR